MTKKDTLSILIKLFGLYLLVIAVQSLPNIGLALGGLRQFEVSQVIWYLVVTIFPILLMGAIALYFVVGTRGVLKWVSDKDLEGNNENTRVTISVGKEELQEIVFSGLGVFFTVSALSRVISGLSTQTQGNLRNFIGLIVQLIIGVYLFFCSKQIVELLEKIEEKNTKSDCSGRLAETEPAKNNKYNMLDRLVMIHFPSRSSPGRRRQESSTSPPWKKFACRKRILL